jgi:hypothetical protein
MKWTHTIVLTIAFFATGGLVLSQLNTLSTINAWVLLLVASATTSLAAYLIARRQAYPGLSLVEQSGVGYRAVSKQMGSRSRLVIGVVSVLPWLLLIPGYLALLLSTRMQLAAHGYLHSGYIYQILNGHIPPENILLPGFPANYYWYYHALIATLSQVFYSSPPLIATILSFVVLFTTLGLLYEVVDMLLVHEKRFIVLTVLAFFSLFGMNLFGTIHSIIRLSPGEQTFQEIIVSLYPQPLFGDNRLTVTLTKYLGGLDGTPMGWLMYVFVILIVIKILSGIIGGKDILLAILAAFAALVLHASEGVFIVVAVPAALFATYLLGALLDGKLLDSSYHKQQLIVARGAITHHWQLSLAITLISAILGLATLRFLLGASGSTTFSLDLISLVGLKSILSMTYPLIPFFLIGAYLAYKSGDRRMIFLSALTVIGMAMGYALRLSNNEYKFTFAATIAMCILCVVPIWGYVFKPGVRHYSWRKAAGFLVLTLMFLNVLTYGLSHLAQPWVKADNFVTNGTRIDSRTAHAGIPYPEVDLGWARDDNGDPYPSDLQYADVFQWARNNTPGDAVLVVPMNHRDQSSLYVLSERVPYVVNGDTMNSSLPEYNQRVMLVNQIYVTEELANYPAQALDLIRRDLPGREKYLLYPRSHMMLSSNPTWYGLKLVYEGRYANLFHIAPK